MRKLTIIIALLTGLIVGYLAGCQSHAPARVVTFDPLPGQRWVDRSGACRVVRTTTRESGREVVWWHHDGRTGADRHCTVGTWRAWARAKGAKVEP